MKRWLVSRTKYGQPSDMNRISIQDLPLEGLKLLNFTLIEDFRGSLCRLFCKHTLQLIWPGPIFQINHTHTKSRGAVRGLHFQYPPCSDKKLVVCLRGEVWDVAVDLRSGSATFLKWHGQELNEFKKSAFLIPEGFAHGFQVRSEEAELLYFHSNYYEPEAQGVINPCDPRIAISWPEVISSLSEKDLAQPYLEKTFSGLII